jgi:hypothetical protein
MRTASKLVFRIGCGGGTVGVAVTVGDGENAEGETVMLGVPAGVTVMDGEGPGADGLGKGDEPGGGTIPIAKL